MPGGIIFQRSGSNVPNSLLKRDKEWGLETIDVVGPPRRFWGDEAQQESLVDEGQDARRWEAVPTPTDLLTSLPAGDNWLSMGRRSQARLNAFALILEDPQRRLDVREVETLSHQVSLVRHILDNETLRRVLIADEVGLGKTIEAGLLLKELLQQRPTMRVLYLAPARLVANVYREFERLGLPFRKWVALDSDARLTDPLIIASIHRAAFGDNLVAVASTPPWDVLVVDECHHLSAWSPEGTDPRQGYRLVAQLVARQPPDGRVVLMSGTPHQGHATRFENLLRLLQGPNEGPQDLAGRVIYRTKDDIVDWNGNPVFPSRRVNPPLVVDLGPRHRRWLENIYEFYRPSGRVEGDGEARRRAAGWRCAQAMQWAASSPHAGLGYLARQAIRAGWPSSNQTLRDALGALRPYRLGTPDEDIDRLYERIRREVDPQVPDEDMDDIETYVPGQASDPGSQRGLERLIEEGIELRKTAGDEKFQHIHEKLLVAAGDEKVVLFAQPIETVIALAGFLERKTGRRPALIIGGQDDETRRREIDSFWRVDGPQFLVSSRAGGEGINLQIARRLIHIDVPWNPMEMEQRVGRIHRFGSRDEVIVDTVVVKDSREADAYRVAREKLGLITSTLVEEDRFEAIFSRVMSLLPPDEFTTLMINGFGSPLSAADQSRLAELVQQGFRDWKEFHDKYGKREAAIRLQDPGLATWEDLAEFLVEFANAKRVAGHKCQRFVREADRAKPVAEDAVVLAMRDGRAHVCADYGEFLVYSPTGTKTPRLGMNTPEVVETLRGVAFPGAPTGAAFLRWPERTPLPKGVSSTPFGVIGFARQTLQRGRSGAWAERQATLRLYVIDGRTTSEIEGNEKGRLIRAILHSSVRKTAELPTELGSILGENERSLFESLRRPTEEEVAAQVRHAAFPLFAGVFTA